MKIAEMIKRLVSRKSSGDQRQGTETLEDGRRQGEGENPYLSARRTWNDQSAANIASRQMFQLLGVLALLVALAAVGGNIYIGSQSKFIPYVVEVDRTRQPMAVAPAEKAAPVDSRVVHASVAAWISDVRLVTPDIALQRKAVFRVYSMLAPNDPATAKTNEWLNGTNESSPFKRAATQTVSVELASVIPQTPDTWQVDWVETTRDRQGVLKGPPQRWRVLVTVYLVPTTPDTSEEDMRNNPLGVHVRDFSWSKLL